MLNTGNNVIIVTRPVHQAQQFIDALSQTGARIIAFPTIDIELRHKALTNTEIQQLTESELWVFTSANAVTGAKRCGLLEQIRPLAIACIGPATAGELQKQGIEVDHVPDADRTSEGLLSLLHADCHFQTATIIRGGQGREKLFEAMRRQGKTVHALDVYKRTVAKPDVNAVQELVDALPATLCITSDQGLLNLLEILGGGADNQLLRSDLIVNSDRSKQLARRQGFTGRIQVALPPGDDGQLSALRQGNFI